MGLSELLCGWAATQSVTGKTSDLNINRFYFFFLNSFPFTVNSYGQPQPPHLFSGPSPMYQISTQDSPGYNRPGKGWCWDILHQWTLKNWFPTPLCISPKALSNRMEHWVEREHGLQGTLYSGLWDRRFRISEAWFLSLHINSLSLTLSCSKTAVHEKLLLMKLFMLYQQSAMR